MITVISNKMKNIKLVLKYLLLQFVPVSSWIFPQIISTQNV